MTHWIRDWLILSTLMVIGTGMLLMLWAIWPLLPARLPAMLLPTLDVEGVISILMLIVIGIGFGKLLSCK